MLTLDLHDNFNGKLFNDNFSHVTEWSAEYKEGSEAKLFYRGQYMGIVEIKAVRTLPFSRMSDVVSFLNMGKSVQKQAHLLNTKYNAGKTLEADAMIMHMVCGYTKRNMEVQNELMKHWWETVEEAAQSITT